MQYSCVYFAQIYLYMYLYIKYNMYKTVFYMRGSLIAARIE